MDVFVGDKVDIGPCDVVFVTQNTVSFRWPCGDTTHSVLKTSIINLYPKIVSGTRVQREGRGTGGQVLHVWNDQVAWVMFDDSKEPTTHQVKDLQRERWKR